MSGNTSSDYYTRRLVALKAKLAAVEADQQTKLTTEAQRSLKIRAEQILKAIDDLTRQQKQWLSAQAQRLSEQANQDLVRYLSPVYTKYGAALCGIYWRSRSCERQAGIIFASVDDLVLDAVSTFDDIPGVPVLHRFVMYLFVYLNKQRQTKKPQPTCLLGLASQLRQWAVNYISQPKRLYGQIENEIKQAQARVQQRESCLLVRIRPSIQQSKSGQNGDRYFIEAWFVQDVAAYRKTPSELPRKMALSQENPETGQSQPVAPTQTYSQQELESTLRRISQQCRQQFEVGRFGIQVFLPLALMQLAVDRWYVRDSTAEQGPRLGTVHHVCLRALERWDKTQYYLQDEWSQRWSQVQEQQGSAATAVLIASAIDSAYGVVNDPNVIGLRLTESLCGGYGSQKPTVLLENILLETGLPLALWMRQSVIPEGCSEPVQCSQMLQAMLEPCSLQQVQQQIQRKRSEASTLLPDKQMQHVGSHLALLWDDPTIRLPVLPSGPGPTRSPNAA